MKKFYEEPELELIKFGMVDIITTSGGGGITEEEWSGDEGTEENPDW